MTPTSPDQVLIDAARHYASRVAAQSVQRITITLADGSKRKLEVPATSRAEDAWPPADGWAIRGRLGACNGTVFRLGGKQLAMFRDLVEAGAEGISRDDLRKRVWDAFTDDRTVQNAAAKVRQAIREAMGWDDTVEPLEATDDLYRLVLPT